MNRGSWLFAFFVGCAGKSESGQLYDASSTQMDTAAEEAECTDTTGDLLVVATRSDGSTDYSGVRVQVSDGVTTPIEALLAASGELHLSLPPATYTVQATSSSDGGCLGGGSAPVAVEVCTEVSVSLVLEPMVGC